MRRLITTLPIAAALAMCLPACGSVPELPGPGALAVNEPQPRTAFAPACPTPTAAAKLRAIEAEIDRAIRAGASPDTLAAEWERLDAAATICRRGRA